MKLKAIVAALHYNVNTIRQWGRQVMMIGSQIGPFLIEKELGSGAMGTVYKAKFQKDEERAIPVALKVVSYGLLGNDGAMARFEREAAILKQLKHPHIVRLLATGRYKQTPFIAMEFVDGESLDRTLTKRGKLDWEDVVSYGKQLCEALQHAHERGIVHRDLKPSNLMVTREGVLKLTDFGIAKDTDVTALTGANSTIGTAAYMSPEQCRGDKTLGAKSDLYSLGICLYELVTGKKPFVAESSVDMFLKHVNETPVRPRKVVHEIPVWLDNLIMFLLEKNKESRPLDAGTVGKMLADIEQKVQSQQSVGAEVANARRIDRPVGEKPLSDEEKDAARSLRAGDKKKRKKKPKPLSKQVWPKAVGLGALLLAVIAVGVYLVTGNFFAAETPTAAFTRVEAATPTGKLEAVEAFLKTHGNTSDPVVEKARTLFRDEKARETERILMKRFGSKALANNSEGFDETAYNLALQAADYEKNGELKRAAELWSSIKDKSPTIDLAKLPAEEEANKARLGWVAEKRLREIQQVVPETLKNLNAQIETARTHEVLLTLEPGNPEHQAIRALLLEKFDDNVKARSNWEKLQVQTEKEADQRIWWLIASQKNGQLKTAKADETDTEKRTTRLQKRITQIEEEANVGAIDAVKRRALGNPCRDILLLYDDDSADAIKSVVARAKKLLETLSNK